MTNEDRLRLEIGARFKLLIDNVEPSARAFATKTGIAKGYISEVTGGTKELSGLAMRRIAAVYHHANLTWVLSGHGTMFLENTSPLAGLVSEQLPTYGPSEGVLEMILRRLKELENELAVLRSLPGIAPKLN